MSGVLLLEANICRLVLLKRSDCECQVQNGFCKVIFKIVVCVAISEESCELLEFPTCPDGKPELTQCATTEVGRA